MNYSIDAGTNITSIAYLWLALKYLLPYVVGFFLIIISVVLAIVIYRRIELSREQIFYGIIGAGVILLIFLLR